MVRRCDNAGGGDVPHVHFVPFFSGASRELPGTKSEHGARGGEVWFRHLVGRYKRFGLGFLTLVHSAN